MVSESGSNACDDNDDIKNDDDDIEGESNS